VLDKKNSSVVQLSFEATFLAFVVGWQKKSCIEKQERGGKGVFSDFDILFVAAERTNIVQLLERQGMSHFVLLSRANPRYKGDY
jgi:hypothetical protein